MGEMHCNLHKKKYNDYNDIPWMSASPFNTSILNPP